jgi:hypothetical protein
MRELQARRNFGPPNVLPLTRRARVPDYDFSHGVRGKYAARYAEGTNVVVISPDVAEIFPNAQAVNEALRTLARISTKTVRVRTKRTKRGG